MPSKTRLSKALLPSAALVLLLGCSDEHGPSGATTAQSASAQAASSAAAPASAPAPAPTPTETAKPHDCIEGSAGEGTLSKPCEAKGLSRQMEVTWTGKSDDKGPSFRVVNKSKLTILYGKVVVYFYDKAGKQIELKDDSGKTRPNQPCSGNLFSGVMAPGEKAVITFSCVQKKHMPEGAAAIEAEMVTVGFADASGKKSEFFWRNNDLAPDARPKGGIKK